MKMVVLVGPQGSGNHLFSKIFSIHDEVHGWKDSLKPNGYFIPHFQEPFVNYWNNIDSIDLSIMGGKKYAITSMSNPYMQNFVPRIPEVIKFTQKLESLGIDTQVVVIGRDKNILNVQQTRLRGGPTWGNMHLLIRRLPKMPFYVSQELLYLYRKDYVRSLGTWLNFPIAWDSPLVDEILKEDQNAKYIKYAENERTDTIVREFLNYP